MIRVGNITIDKATTTITCGERSHTWQRNTRRARGKSIRFRLVQHLILADGVTLGDLFDMLYGEYPDGGPDQGIECLRVMLCHAKPVLAKLGLELTNEKISGRMRYRVARPTA